MIKILNLASGSKGNATLFGCDDTVFLLDDGVGKHLLGSGLKRLGFGFDDLHHVFLTHNHSDHIKGLKYLPEGVTLLSREATIDLPHVSLAPFETYNIDPFAITVLPTSHDAPDPTGYLIEAEGKKIVYMTDTGRIKKDVVKKCVDADVYMFESNHDPEMLKNSGRPMMLIKRIASTKGHLSNQKSADYLLKMVGSHTKAIFLAHLSEECNKEDLALACLRDSFLNEGLDLSSTHLACLKQWEETYFEI